MRKVRDKESSVISLAILLWARRLWISRLTWLLLWGRGREKFALSERRRIGFELFFHLWEKNFGAWTVKIYRHGLYLHSQSLSFQEYNYRVWVENLQFSFSTTGIDDRLLFSDCLSSCLRGKDKRDSSSSSFCSKYCYSVGKQKGHGRNRCSFWSSVQDLWQ